MSLALVATRPIVVFSPARGRTTLAPARRIVLASATSSIPRREEWWRAFAIRTAGDPAALAPLVRDVIRRADPSLPITETQTLTALVEKDTASRTVQVRVLSAFALIAFVLAAVGIHGLLSFTVSQRTQEIGVRVALGAQARDILSMILSRGLLLAAAGIVPGAVLAYLSGRSMEALLAGVKPWDATAFASAMALSVLMTVGGSIAPTLRALRVDPITALRAE